MSKDDLLAAARYPGLNGLPAGPIRDVVKNLFDMIGQVQQQVPNIGSVSQPLQAHMDANTKQIKALADPTAPQDAVTLKYLQHYVESRVSAATAAVKAAAATIPGAPGGPTPPISTLPSLAPNELAALQTVYASATWDFSTDQGPNGRGAFIDAAVPVLHGIDANFGNVHKNPGQNQYNGHAVDAVCWKDPDHITAEIIDVISTGLQWAFVDRTSANLALWQFP